MQSDRASGSADLAAAFRANHFLHDRPRVFEDALHELVELVIQQLQLDVAVHQLQHLVEHVLHLDLIVDDHIQLDEHHHVHQHVVVDELHELDQHVDELQLVVEHVDDDQHLEQQLVWVGR